MSLKKEIAPIEGEGSCMQNLLPFAFFQEKIIPIEEAKISITSNSVQYGTSCFGGIRGYLIANKVKIFRLYDHYVRLHHAIKMLGIPLDITGEEFEETIIKLTLANSPQSNFYIRPFFYSKDPNLTPSFEKLKFELAIYMLPLECYFDPAKGLHLMISSWKKVSDSEVPTKAKVGGVYVNSSLAKDEAIQNGYDDALMMDDRGDIVEASIANLFIVWRGEVLMPETGAAMLEGITRRTAIEFLEEEGIKVRAERIDRSMIYSCDELILTGTAVQVVFAETVDKCKISQEGKPGPICQLLQEKLKQAIEGKHPKSSQWLTEIELS